MTKEENAMSAARLTRNLLNKLINARIDLDAYLRLRKAKGYMTVSESDELRDNLFDLCTEMRHQTALPEPEAREALHNAAEAMVTAAVSLMSGRHDCPQFVAVDADKLERCLTVLTTSIKQLNVSTSHASA
jgi:biofilm regulator BssR